MTSTCNTCIYMHRTGEDRGECRRHAPAIPKSYGRGVFPWVNTLEDWCGEYSGNTQPLTERETRAFGNPDLMPGVITIKPTPYRKVTTAEEGFTDYGN